MKGKMTRFKKYFLAERYIPSDPMQKLLHKVFESDYSVRGILSEYFEIYQSCITGKWGQWDNKKERFVEFCE